MFNPVSTYRIQFNHEFTFLDFDRIIPYLNKLGITTIYASPILEASPGSMHGYDTTNPLRINPEIGTEEQLQEISKKLGKLGMSWIQDIVPNHMAFHTSNLWLMDVLEKGVASDYFTFFDINWSGNIQSPVMVPFLGDDLEKVIADGALKIVSENDKFYLNYSDQNWPLSKETYARIESLNSDLNQAIAIINEDKASIISIAETQHYRLCNWKETNVSINFRRFFTVNGLICLNIQHEETFEAYHSYLKTLLEKKFIQGLRVDHIDGLYQPEAYLTRLRKFAGEDTYIVIEKILEKGEVMPSEWPIQGNTGYDFLAVVNNLLTNSSSENILTDYYDQLVDPDGTVEEQIKEKKALILQDFMQGELENLYQFFLSKGFPSAKEIEADLVKETLAQLLILCPVYRFYGDEFPLGGFERKRLKKLLKEIALDKKLKPAVKILKSIWLENYDAEHEDGKEKARSFYLRCMQFTGPLMAKGVEDTLMYTYQRFIAHNEVGDAPDAFGISRKEFHKWMLQQRKNWSLSLKGTATHDTKRGEDVRARLNVISDIPEEWIAAVEQWNTVNEEEIKQNGLHPNDVYFIYQTLIGSYPMPGDRTEDYQPRLDAYFEKALREGKQSSNWAEPDTDYENAVKKFSASLINKENPFWTSFSSLHKKVSDFGILNSLTQLLLKYTTPGVPDIYQGTEFWDLSLVDPDNRRTVDYGTRLKVLNTFKIGSTLGKLWEERYSGNIKLWLHAVLLKDHKENKAFFLDAEYIPLKVKGKFSENILAFALKNGSEYRLVAVPLYCASISPAGVDSIMKQDWKNTRVILPELQLSSWESLLDQESIQQLESELLISSLFKNFPLAYLKVSSSKNPRGSGLLLHITSLPSTFGIGDFGPQAKHFVDQLFSSKQKYWQVLPLNPTSLEQFHSPYSSVSSMAGNVLLISPEALAESDGLLSKEVLREYSLEAKPKISYEEATLVKEKLLDHAYQNFNEASPPDLISLFKDFCEKENYWLNDFAIFTDLKAVHDNAPWFQWEDKYKFRDETVLREYVVRRAEQIRKIKWLQFMFSRQWNVIKKYANSKHIQLIGDLPFYIGHDSVDVWSNPGLFSLDQNGAMAGVAGVPPDYFNEEGQLWGMPVFNWDALKATQYRWWIQRISKNMELYDFLRLDHFRAFSSYWEVPAQEETAINGLWKQGPGNDFFEVIKSYFPEMPFIAEDLGDITAEVYQLRDAFILPGMKVLQFAFGPDLPISPHIIHNYDHSNCVVYTGTHDNNTTLGWYQNDATKKDRKRLSAYAGNVNEKNVHDVLIKLAMSSISKLVIIPVQDLLGLDQFSRMNTPASISDNWLWRLKSGQLNKIHLKQLSKWTSMYKRI
jgi:malto-oligosyltrehalose synthase/4-alpha-glucanotransferase